jgi:hypothetical protein
MTLRCDGTNVVVAENYFLFTSGSAALPSVAISGDADTGMWSPAANTLAWSNNGAETMRLDSSGNLGLGVTPSAWVGDKSYQVNWGSISSGYDYGVNLNSVAYRSNTTWYYQVTGQAPARYEQLGGNHRWFSAPSGTAGGAISFTNTMTLDSSGNLLRGQTSSGNLNSRGFYSDAAGYFGQNHLNTDASGSFYAYFGFNGGTIGSITQSGTTAVLYNTTSDQRLKTNIVDAPDAAALIDSIKVRSFDWISDETHQRYGFIAQELVAVAPEAVHAPADPDEMMAVDYSKLVPMLIKEIQSLRARVAALEQV